MSCLNKHDVQSRHIMTTDGVAECLYSGCGNRGGQQYILVHRERADTQFATRREVPVLELYARSNGRACDEKGKEVMEMGNEFENDEYEVRRLTPTECARLQGFPPDWCADVPHSDSAEYKLWGNGIALPSILPMMQNAVNLIENWKVDEYLEGSEEE